MSSLKSETFATIKELDARLQIYRQEMKEFWLAMMLPMTVIMGLVMFGLFFVLSLLAGSAGSVDWRIGAGIFTMASMIAPYSMFKPEKPTLEAVVYDDLLNALSEATRRLS